MTTSNSLNPQLDFNEIVQGLKASGDSFAVATVVRTVSVTAAKPGAKAILNSDGAIIEGWIGGGCAKYAVMKAAQECIVNGQPRLVSIQPADLLKEQGLQPGPQADGIVAAKNMCPSQGSMDIFIEPVLSNPELLVLGASPVATMLVRLAPLFDFSVAVAGLAADLVSDTGVNHNYVDLADIPHKSEHRYTVVATQGADDINALVTALGLESRFLTFVGSQKKLAYLCTQLADSGQPAEAVNRITGPAGLDIGGVTPQEIALSILAEIIAIRRRKTPINKGSLVG